MANLEVVLVTPEETLFERPIVSLKLPLFDGSAGIYSGRAPLVGRLGTGELRLELDGGQHESWFIDGGFVQVKGSVVSVLTNAAIAVSQIDTNAAEKELQALNAERVGPEDSDYASHARRAERARRQLTVAGRK